MDIVDKTIADLKEVSEHFIGHGDKLWADDVDNAIKVIEQLSNRHKELINEVNVVNTHYSEVLYKLGEANERIEAWKEVAEIRQHRTELNLHLIPGINDDALDSELYSLNIEEEKLLVELKEGE